MSVVLSMMLDKLPIERPWSQPADEVLRALGAHPETGLGQREAQERRRRAEIVTTVITGNGRDVEVRDGVCAEGTKKEIQ